MSCLDDENCKEPQKRRVALGVLGLMAIIFISLSIMSFLPSREQAIPAVVHFGEQDAVYGKRVFQSYNCMGCHTIVGNGAYLGPDLTKTYATTGPAWLAAFLPSAGGWPTSAAVQAQLLNATIEDESGTGDITAYRQRYPGAAERIDRRGGHATLMPNLPLDRQQIQGLLAFLKYMSSMNTEGWPPKPKVDGLAVLRVSGAHTMPLLASSAGVPGNATSVVAVGLPATPDPITVGASLVANYGCLACHATDSTRTVGPGWGELVSATRELADGSHINIDDHYLIESIRNPGTHLAAGYPAGVMPAYGAMITDSDMNDIIAYLHSLKEN
jgi:mono/diheme cytochrome c family protein